MDLLDISGLKASPAPADVWVQCSPSPNDFSAVAPRCSFSAIIGDCGSKTQRVLFHDPFHRFHLSTKESAETEKSIRGSGEGLPELPNGGCDG